MDTTPLAREDDVEKNDRLQIDESRQLFRGRQGLRWTFRLSFALPSLLAFIFSLIGIAVTLIWVASLNTIESYSVGTAEDTIGALATDLLTSTGNRIDTSIENLLTETVAHVALAVQMQKSKLLRPPSLDEYYTTFFSTIKVNPFLSGLAYADAEQMTYIGFYRNDDGSFEYELILKPPAVCTLCNTTATPPGQKMYIAASQDGTPLTAARNKTYDFLARDWYVNCTRANATIWTDPYTFSSGDVGVSLVAPVYSKINPGAIAGAFVLDLSLAPLTLFLKKMVSLEGGFASLLASTNELLATSTDQPLTVQVGDDKVLISAFASNDAFTKATTKKVVESRAAGRTNATFKNEDFWFSFQTFKSSSADIPDFRCTSVIGREATQYTAPVTNLKDNFRDSMFTAIRNSALITSAFIVAGFLLIIAFVFVILLRPLKELQESMLKATKFNFAQLMDDRTAAASRLKEVNTLQYVFRQMIATFAASLQANSALSRRAEASSNATGRHPSISR
ncbi:hypothetical protein HDU88_004009 [Geranomyces variabilis]|nr:hypothetical protein HDU88_004009 [Geranomyces variabilis]